MVSKRRLVGNLLFLALLFVGIFHTFLTVAFHAGYFLVAIGTVVGSIVCLIAVNVPAYLD